MVNPAAVRQKIFEGHGKVKFYHPEKRYGFIKADDASVGDVLLPERCLQELGLSTVRKGTCLLFEATEGRKGHQPQVRKIVRFT